MARSTIKDRFTDVLHPWGRSEGKLATPASRCRSADRGSLCRIRYRVDLAVNDVEMAEPATRAVMADETALNSLNDGASYAALGTLAAPKEKKVWDAVSERLAAGHVHSLTE